MYVIIFFIYCTNILTHTNIPFYIHLCFIPCLNILNKNYDIESRFTVPTTHTFYITIKNTTGNNK